MGSAAAVMSESEFREKLAEVERILKQVESTVSTLFDRCNRAMRFLPPGLSGGMVSALTRLNELIAEFFTEMAKIVANPGWPFGLMSAGDDWVQRVAGPLSEFAARLGPDQMRLDSHWTGSAAEAYAAVVPAQQKALEQVRTITDAIDTNLTKTAVGIFAMWAGVLLAVVSYIAELIAEAAAAATVVGAPPAAGGAGLSTAKVIGLVVACLGLFVTFVGTVVDSLTTLEQTLESPGKNWPAATTAEFDDGSLSDGDRTDWRYKTDD